MMSKLRVVSLIGVAVVVLPVLFFVYGGPVLGPWFQYESQKIDSHRFLSACGEDEMRLGVGLKGDGYGRATLNFPTRTLTVADTGSYRSNQYLIFWSELGSGFSSVPSLAVSKPKTYTENEIIQIKAALAALPPPTGKWLYDPDSYQDEFHVIFFQGGGLCIYDYSKDKAPPQLEELCRVMGVTASFKWWEGLPLGSEL